MIILMIGFLDVVDVNKDSYQIVELYAGEQRLVKLSKGLGLKTASMDRDYDHGDNKATNNSMDMNTSAGFAFLNLILSSYPSRVSLREISLIWVDEL